jgi:multiple sugar transport system substrate-binding protein
MGAYVIWKFAKNKAMAKKFLVDLETKYIGAFENSKFYNFPSWPASVTNIPTRVARDPAKPTGKYSVLAEIAEKYTLNPGWPGNTNAAIDEIFYKWMIPQMFAEVAQGKRTAEDAAKIYDRSFRRIFQKWRNRGKI